MAREPMFNAPTVVVGTLAVLALVHGGLALLPEGQEVEVTFALAFDPVRYLPGAPELPGGRTAAVTSFVTHQLVHGDITHLLINSAWLLAFGSAIARRIGALRFLMFGIASGIAGAALFLAVRYGQQVPMVGASGAVSGLMGGAFRFFFPLMDLAAVGPLDRMASLVPRMGIWEALGERRTRLAIGIWVAMNIIMAVAAPAFTDAGGIAWEAHLGGFFFGFLTFGLFDPVSRDPVAAPRPPTLH